MPGRKENLLIFFRGRFLWALERKSTCLLRLGSRTLAAEASAHGQRNREKERKLAEVNRNERDLAEKHS